MSKINSGEMDISLDGRNFLLRPTLRTAKDLNRQFGALGDAIDQLRKANLDAVVAVIRIGANLEGREARALEELVWGEMGRSDEAFGELLVSLIRFVATVQRGGKPISDEPEGSMVIEAQDEGN